VSEGSNLQNPKIGYGKLKRRFLIAKTVKKKEGYLTHLKKSVR
jgi:hypothetical protein